MVYAAGVFPRKKKIHNPRTSGKKKLTAEEFRGLSHSAHRPSLANSANSESSMTSTLRGFIATQPNPNPSARSIDLGSGSEVIYNPRFVSPDRAWEWFDYLNKEIPWTRPTIRVFGKSCLQPRDTCYVASEGLSELEYSGYRPHTYSWDDYPVLKNILEAVHEALPGSRFNSLLLNRYNCGSDSVSWHSDDEKLYGATPEIASVSFGCEREFLLKKKPIRSPQAKRLKLDHPVQHSFVLKHGSLLVMKGYTQRDWNHSVPKRAKADSVRINLTFRCVML